MTIEYSKLRSVTARQFSAALQADGFELLRQKGSHRHYRHPDGRRVTVSFHHSSDTFRHGTLRSMVEMQARWSPDDLIRLKLIG
jgi:predicted RNA binding protein YcfA (HicA-like mRNA interferase family)